MGGMGDGPKPVDVTAVTQPRPFAESERLAAGTRVGAYEIVSFVGAGGMGEVYRAHDGRLNRDVALKFLRPGAFGETGGPAARARLLREAQAMARLSHPHVVTVFEVGAHEDQIFVAMEFVDGQTLRHWLAARPRSRREILDVYQRAGRGLAAVHQAGLVHCDFKPDNVIVDDDGRVRVMDFGLAGRSVEPGEPAARPPEPVDTAVGPGGSGTPPYMAPEQHRDLPFDARADQFAFSVSLWEALYGARPFAGTTYAELKENILAGKIAEPPARARVPAWIRTILLRGLRVDPGARFPSMTALLDALADDPAVRWRRVGYGIALAIAAVALTVAARRSAVTDPCAGASAHLAGVWDPSVRATMHEAFLASKRPYSEKVFDHVAARLDNYTSGWSLMRTQACEATAVRHEQSEALLDRRMQCLDRRLGDVRALTARLAGNADGETVDRAVGAAGKLESLDECADAESLNAATALPVDVNARRQIAALRTRLADIRAVRLTGKATVAREQAEVLAPEVEKVGYPPLELATLMELATARGLVRATEGQVEALRKALQIAARLRDGRTEARIWATIIIETAQELGHPDQALAMRDAAEAAVGHAGDTAISRGELETALARVYEAKEAWTDAEAALRRGIALEESVPGHDAFVVAAARNTLAIVVHEEGRSDDSIAEFQKALAIYEREVAPGHPYIAGILLNIGNIRKGQGHLDEARAAQEKALAIWTEAYGPDARDTALPIHNMGEIDLEEGKYDDAIARFQRAVAIKEKTAGPEHPLTSTSVLDLGVALAHAGRYDEAETTLDRARAIIEKSIGKETSSFALVLTAQALLAHLRGRDADALTRAEQAVALSDKVNGPNHPSLAKPLLLVGQSRLALGRAHEAVAPLERAIALGGTGSDREADKDVADARLALAQAQKLSARR